MAFPKFCSNCGSPLYPGSKFCAKCGTKILIPTEEPIKEEQIKEPEPAIEEPTPIQEETTVIEEPAQEESEIVEEPVEEKIVEEPQQEEIKTPVEEIPQEEVPISVEEVQSEPEIESIKEEPQEEEQPIEEFTQEETIEEEVLEKPQPEPEQVEEKAEEVKQEEPVADSEPHNATKVVLSAAALAGYVFGVDPSIPEPPKDEKVDDLLEPRKKFMESLEREHEESADEFFDELVKKSGVDVNANFDAMREHHKLSAQKANYERQMAKKKSIKLFGALIIIFMTIGLAGLIIFGVFAFTGLLEEEPFSLIDPLLIFLTFGICVGLGILFIILYAITNSVSKKKYGPKISEIENKLKEIEEMGYQQLDPLNQAFDFNVMNQLMRKATPLIRLDDHPDMNKIETLINKYKWKCPEGRYVSTMYMKTGSILGNPFILYRGRIERTVQETYTGSLTITYTKKVTIGKTTTYMPVVQTLTASITKPRPDFSNDTTLVYGSEAAPHLSFSRSPMIHKYDQKSLTKLFKEREKFIDDYTKKHPEFTPLGNDQFEDFFDGVNRDNEVEYRLLFTPLAQQAMLDLITNPTPIGDTFSFRKDKMINTIALRGHNDIDYEGDPRIFMGYDIDEMKKRFVRLNKTFFKSMYFHLAPLMAIPLYQQYPSDEYIFRRDQQGAFSTTLCEMLANRYYEKYFAHSACHTPLILKCQEYRIVGNSIQCLIHSYGYHTIPHTEYCPRLGGDGHMHDVPVTWYEYQLVEKTTPFVIHESFINKKQYGIFSQDEDYKKIYNSLNVGQFSFFKGYFTFIKNDDDKYDPSSLNEFLEKKLNN